jgi:phosphate transport system protein
MVRFNFTQEMKAAEAGLLAEGELVRQQVGAVMTALANRDATLAEKVIEDDDRIDESYLSTESRILNLIALQAPVASDLRLISALLHCNGHLERMGDLCVNIAKFVSNQMPYPTDSPMIETLEEMARQVGDMLETALAAFSERSVELAEELPVKDNAVDVLNRRVLEQLKTYVGDEESFIWAGNLLLVARYVERLGDHAVDLAEQAAFLVSGVFREFADASHPEIEAQLADAAGTTGEGVAVGAEQDEPSARQE